MVIVSRIKKILSDKNLIIIFAVVYAIINIGNYKLGIAQTSSDDGILSGAFISKNPENYFKDAGAQSMKVMGSYSIMNQIPTWLYINFGINPEIFWVFFVYFQNIFYVISIYFLSRCMALSKVISFFVVLMAINLRIHTLNLAWIGDLEWMPYGTWVVLPIELFCIGFLVKKRFKPAIFCHVISIFIHPTFSLGLTITIILLVLFRRKSFEIRKYIILLIIPYTVFAYRNQKNKNIFLDEIDENLVTSVLNNSHVNTLLFQSTNMNFGYTVVSAFTILSLIYLINFQITKQNFRLGNVDLIIVLSSVLLMAFLATNLIAIYGRIVPVLQANLQRFSIIYVILVLIYSLKILSESKVKEIKFIALPLYVTIFATSNLFIHIMISVFWMVYGIRKSRLVLTQSLMTLFFQLWIFNKFSNSENMDLLNSIKITGQSINWDSAISARYSGFFVLILLFLMWLILASKDLLENNSKLQFLLQSLNYGTLLFIAFILLENRQFDTLIRENDKLKAYSDIQIWARENSKPGQYFMVDNLYVYRGWRNATNRPVLSYMNIGNSYVYLKSDKYWSDKYAEHFINNEPYSAQGLINETQSVKSFGQEFGASFVVWKNEWVPLELPAVYVNDEYTIYSLEK